MIIEKDEFEQIVKSADKKLVRAFKAEYARLLGFFSRQAQNESPFEVVLSPDERLSQSVRPFKNAALIASAGEFSCSPFEVLSAAAPARALGIKDVSLFIIESDLNCTGAPPLLAAAKCAGITVYKGEAQNADAYEKQISLVKGLVGKQKYIIITDAFSSPQIAADDILRALGGCKDVTLLSASQGVIDGVLKIIKSAGADSGGFICKKTASVLDAVELANKTGCDTLRVSTLHAAEDYKNAQNARTVLVGEKAAEITAPAFSVHDFIKRTVTVITCTLK